MKLYQFILLLCLYVYSPVIHGQTKIDSVQFFLDENILNVKLTTDLGNLLSRRIKDDTQKAVFTCKLPDSTEVSEEISINLRGKMRRSICYVPPMKLHFNTPNSPSLSPLKDLKLVSSCKVNSVYDKYLLKEYLIYKMYNLFTDKSFRVRLCNVTYEDNKGKKKPLTHYAFFIEDVDAMAKRNKCKEWEYESLNTEKTDREQMTMVALFEFMIGNTDFSIPNNHNIKLIRPKKDSTAKPFVVPYDFDYAGLVNAEYAAPAELLGIEKVTDRLYRGFPRTIPELQAAIQIFNEKKDTLYELIKKFEILDNGYRKDMINYIDDFYTIINDKRMVQYTFIDNARIQ